MTFDVLKAALGPLADCGQFFVWHLYGRKADGKYEKEPLGRIDHTNPANWQSFDEAATRAAQLNAGMVGATSVYVPGLYLTEALGAFLVDVDHLPDAYTMDAVATQVRDAILAPGVMMEWSSSTRGVHFIGLGKPPFEHKTRAKGEDRVEVYTKDRGIAFDTSNQAWGVVAGDNSARLAQFIKARGLEKKAAAVVDGELMAPDPLLAMRALTQQLRKVAEAQPGTRNDVLNMACYVLAGYVGAGSLDEEMVSRELHRVTREAGWDNLDKVHRTIVSSLRDGKAAPILVPKPLPGLAPPQPVGIGQMPIQVQLDVKACAEQLRDAISAAGSLDELTDKVVPQIITASLPEVYVEQMVKMVKARLAMFGADMPVGRVRSMLRPSRVTVVGAEMPEWLTDYCYVLSTDRFFNIGNGMSCTRAGFQAMFSRMMPMKESGKRHDPVEWAMERWGIEVVDDSMYRPGYDRFFQWNGKRWANTYVEGSFPVMAAAIEPHVANAIEEFKHHLWKFCNEREAVYMALLQWMAHNVQRPGTKIRWSPLLKGVQGDGKSILGTVLRCAMGWTNVKTTGNSTLNNSGGFTDWAVGAAVNVIEEIYLVGKERHRLYNAMKDYIGNDIVDVNAKGRPNYGCVNTTNHMACTNHNDAIPLEDGDRRWMTIFAQHSTIADFAARCGFDTVEGLVARFGRIGDSARAAPGQWRAWLSSIDLSGFDPNARAPQTNEGASMQASGRDELDELVETVIHKGGVGIAIEAFSSSALRAAVKLHAALEDGEVPQNRGWNHVLSRMGYQQLPKPAWWNGKTHRIWVKNGYSENWEKFLTATIPAKSST